MIDSLFYLSRKIPKRCENSFFGLQNKLQKALLFNEENHNRNELTQCIDFLRKDDWHFFSGYTLLLQFTVIMCLENL